MAVPISLDSVRAGLGCLLVAIQAREAFNAKHERLALAPEWPLSVAVCAHLLWLASSLFGWSTRYYCCVARMAPRLVLVWQILTQRALPPSGIWFSKEFLRRQRWAWRAMAEAFFYSCGEFPVALVIPAALMDIASSGAVWASVYMLYGDTPAPMAAAYAVLRVLLAIGIYCWQRNGVTEWLCRRVPARWSWTGLQVAAAAKLDAGYTRLASETPVRFSMMCCNDPTMLSRIAAASSKDLEPVRVERLSASGDGTNGGLGLARRPGAAAAAPTATSTTVGGTEAYELARRLVSSAGPGSSGAGAGGSNSSSGGSSGGSSAGGAGEDAIVGNNRGYTSAARKVRVCVKIPDRSPEDLPAGWDGGLQIDGQRDAAVVLFTYMRRGCIQLVFDLVGYRLANTLTGTGTGPRQSPPQPPTLCLQGHAGGAQTERDVVLLRDCSPAVGPAATASLGDLALVAEAHGTGVAAQQLLPSPVLTREHLLRVVQSAGLLEGRTVTVQVGPSVSLVRVPGPSPGGRDGGDVSSGPDGSGAVAEKGWHSRAPGTGPAPAVPPDVRVWPQVVCSAAGWWQAGSAHHHPEQHQRQQRAALRDVVVSCSWKASDGAAPPCWPGSPKATASVAEAEPPLPPLQLTARQQGRFLPVAAGPAGPGGPASAASGRKAWRETLSRGTVTAAVDGLPCVAAGAAGNPKASADGAVAACRLAFAPVRADGLVQVELSCGGVHSATSACVLLVSSAAVAFELEQVLVAAGCGGGDGGGGGGALSPDGGPPAEGAMVQQLVHDLGTFMDVAASAAANAPLLAASAPQPGRTEAPPVIAWSLPTPAVPGATPVAEHALLNESRQGGSGAGDAGDADGASRRRRQQQHLCGLASLGSRLGFNLLRYFLSCDLPSCAGYVLDALQEQLGLPASLVALYVCPDGMTLLHHAARSGAFGAVAALACWLEARGCAPDWEAATPDGLTPLHLLAVAPGGGAAAAAVQLRWRGAACAWRTAAPLPRGCGTAPAEFAAMAAGPAAAARWRRAVTAASTLGVGAAWRTAVAARQRIVPAATMRAGWDLVAPSLSFRRAALEAEYETEQASRAVLLDHIFLAMYMAYWLSQAAKGNWTLTSCHGAGSMMLALRVVLLQLCSPAWGCLSMLRWRRPRWAGLGLGARLGLRLPRRGAALPAAGPSCSASRSCGERGRSGSDSGATAGPGEALTRRPQLRLSYEGRVMLQELLRTLVMLCLVAGLLPVPKTWRRLLALRLDWVFNIFLRPIAYQLRVLPSVVAAALALVGETSVMAYVVWKPTSLIGAVLALAMSLARGLTTHGAGLCFTVLLQASARRRFLAQYRRRKTCEKGAR